MIEYAYAVGETADENVEQICLLRWAQWQTSAYPVLALLFHIPNGGKRSKTEAARFKAQGVRAGIPDLCLPVQRGGYAGLYIELKAKKNEPTKEQLAWLSALDTQGYKTAVCWGWEAASRVLLAYLRQEGEKDAK